MQRRAEAACEHRCNACGRDLPNLTAAHCDVNGADAVDSASDGVCDKRRREHRSSDGCNANFVHRAVGIPCKEILLRRVCAESRRERARIDVDDERKRFEHRRRNENAIYRDAKLHVNVRRRCDHLLRRRKQRAAKVGIKQRRHIRELLNPIRRAGDREVQVHLHVSFDEIATRHIVVQVRTHVRHAEMAVVCDNTQTGHIRSQQ